MSARAKILQAAGEIAATDGVLALGIDNVNRRAGVSKGAFFYHFKTKEDMIGALLESVLSEFDREIQQRIDQGANTVEAMVDAALNELQHRSALIGSLVSAISIDPALAKRVRDHSECWHTRACTEAGLTQDAGFVLHLLLDGLFMGTIMKDPQRSAAEIADIRRIILLTVHSIQADQA